MHTPEAQPSWLETLRQRFSTVQSKTEHRLVGTSRLDSGAKRHGRGDSRPRRHIATGKQLTSSVPRRMPSDDMQSAAARPAEQPQPLAPHSSSERRACAAAASSWASRVPEDVPVLLTYMTSLPRIWALGTSAAMHGIPLVVMGLGRSWGGPGVRIPAAMRAVEMVNRSAAFR